MKKKLLHINITSNWGSTGKIASGICELANKVYWDTYIAHAGSHTYSHSVEIKVGNRYNRYLHYGEQYFRDNEGLCSRQSTRKLVSQIRDINPDIIHLHNIHDHYLNYQILFEYLNETDIKVVWTFHDFWAVTGHCMHFISKDCLRFESECHDCPMQKVYPKTLIDRSRKNFLLKKRLFTSCKNLTIVPVSEWVEEMTRKSFLKEKPIRQINNGIDINVFKPTSFDKFCCHEIITRMEGKFIILSVASQWAYDKGLEDYKRISTLLKKDEIIVLVGVSDDINKNLPANIIGIGHISNATELAAIYTRADVVTVFSSAETFGLTVVEGYACGTPAVVYNNTALPALITPDTGLVVENKNWYAAYDAIRQIQNKGKSHYSSSCITLAHKKYDKDKCFRKYIDLYEELTKI